jgi:cbb3-type cytochrome oxidase subunit 3
MRRMKKIHVDLASHPLRNRRFFFLIGGTLIVLVCFILILAGYTYSVYSKKNRNFALTKAQIDERLQETQLEEKRLNKLIEDMSQKYGERVDYINTLIYRKSFSWVDFFSALEESRPETCYLVSMIPSLKDDAKMEVRLKVASPNLNELLKLNKNLSEKHFTKLRTLSESRDETGMLISEISLVYERTV